MKKNGFHVLYVLGAAILLVVTSLGLFNIEVNEILRIVALFAGVILSVIGFTLERKNKHN